MTKCIWISMLLTLAFSCGSKRDDKPPGRDVDNQYTCETVTYLKANEVYGRCDDLASYLKTTGVKDGTKSYPGLAGVTQSYYYVFFNETDLEIKKDFDNVRIISKANVNVRLKADIKFFAINYQPFDPEKGCDDWARKFNRDIEDHECRHVHDFRIIDSDRDKSFRLKKSYSGSGKTETAARNDLYAKVLADELKDEYETRETQKQSSVDDNHAHYPAFPGSSDCKCGRWTGMVTIVFNEKFFNPKTDRNQKITISKNEIWQGYLRSDGSWQVLKHDKKYSEYRINNFDVAYPYCDTIGYYTQYSYNRIYEIQSMGLMPYIKFFPCLSGRTCMIPYKQQAPRRNYDNYQNITYTAKYQGLKEGVETWDCMKIPSPPKTLDIDDVSLLLVDMELPENYKPGDDQIVGSIVRSRPGGDFYMTVTFDLKRN